MGISAGLGSLLAAGIGAASSAHTQAANAAAQSKLNKKTMDFNHKEAELARKWEANEAAINRLFNQRQSNTAMTFSANQAKIDRSFQASEALKGRNFEAQQADIARQFDAQQSLLARQFEERMSSTAHQREVSDLRAAGLNPILSATGGSGASTPVAPVIGAPLPAAPTAHGSSASGSALPGTSAKGVAAAIGGLNAYMKRDIMSEFINTAMNGLRLDNDIRRADAADKNAEAAMKNARAHEKEAETGSKAQSASERKINAEIAKVNADISIAFSDLDIRKDLRDATVEEKKANVARLISAANLTDEQAAYTGLQKVELERKMRYGSVLMAYLPSDARDYIANYFIDFIKENQGALEEFVNKSDGDIFSEEKAHKAVLHVVESICDWTKKKMGKE